MAPSSFSPNASISSRTLSIGSGQPPPIEPRLASADTPVSLLAYPLAFLQPTREINMSFVAAAKRYLDPVAAGVSESQRQRLQQLRRKRKRGGEYEDNIKTLRLSKLHLDGFGVQQVFEQTRKIVDATAEEIKLSLPENGQTDVQTLHDIRDAYSTQDAGNGTSDIERFHTDSNSDDEVVDWNLEGEDGEGDEQEFHSAQPSDDHLDAESGLEAMSADDGDRSDGESLEIYKPDPNGLNDGFFSIDNFNRITDFLEQQDQRGEAAQSDDDEIDWAMDPMREGSVKSQSSSDKEDDGPTFGNFDINASEGHSEDEELEDGDLDDFDKSMNANNVMYADFFAPPPRKASKNKKGKSRSNIQTDQRNGGSKGEEDAEIEGTMARVHRDLFEDDDDMEGEEELSDADPSDPKARRSTHERSQAKISKEIRRLEAANVAKREWQLSGEVRAAERPLNSLLEENLEFEQAGKPVPIIGAEVSEEIEALIKRRILGGEFDEVRRRRPDDLATGPAIRRGQFQLDDTKASKSLAEIYEEEHLRLTDPNFVEAKDEKLKKEHDEIAALWKTVSAKLDSLSASHFKPKAAAPNLEIRVDAPAIEMEDARPTAGGDVSSASMLAPQELYKPGDSKSNTEIMTKSGMPMAREELSREQKTSRRRRAKERARKTAVNTSKPAVTNGKAKQQAEKKHTEQKRILANLKQGGVQVIGRGGVVTDIDGAEIKEGTRKSGGSYKL